MTKADARGFNDSRYDATFKHIPHYNVIVSIFFSSIPITPS